MSAAAKDGLVAAIGLMSGTSMDGIDAALIWTDGVSAVRTGAALTVPYAKALRRRLQGVVAERGAEPKAREKVAREITLAHAEAVKQLLAATGIGAEAIDVIGFHGHTVFHNPA
jgi:anhydro-N-acetylmuramic acid kinase